MSEETVPINAEQRKMLGGITGKGFMPGKSGNPSGRPSSAKRIRERAQEEGDNCIEFYISVRNNPEEKTADRMAAANAIMDRAFGKPTQPLSGSDDPDKPQLPSIAISFVEPGKE